MGDGCHILKKILFSSLKKIREEYKSLFNFSLDLIFVHDLKGNFLDANDIALKTLGYTKEEILNLSFKDLMNKDQARMAFDMIYQAVEKGEQTKLFKFKLKTKEGNFVYLKSSGIPLKENGEVYAVLCIAKDITEHKKVEQRLKESEDKYQIMSENANDLIFILNNKLKFEYINEPPLFKILGYSINDIMNTNLLKVIHPDDLERFLREFNESFEKIEGTVEVRVKHKDGHYIWTESDGNVFTDKDREQKLLVILRDITKRKEGEKKLRESEEKYRLISENANDLISILNKNFKLEYLNEKSILKASGFIKEELIGKSVLDFIHPNDLKQSLKKFREVFKTGEGVIDVRTRRKDGTYRWFETRGSTFIDNNGEVKYLLVSRDITERKIVEQKLKKSEEKYRLISENTFDIIAILNDKFELEYMNKQPITRNAGYTIGELIKKKKVLDLIHPDDLGESLKLLKKGEGLVEYRTYRKDGTYRWVEGRLNTFLDANGEKKYLIISRDINEKKIAKQKLKESEESLTKLNKDLEKRIEERTKKLKESEEKHRLISENANDLITILNQKFEHEYINEETYLKILGYSNDDMLGKTRLDLIHPDDIKQGMKALRNGFKYGEGIAELRLKHKDGHYIWIETKGKTFIDSNGETKALTISRDISERKKVEKKIANLAKFPSENPNPVLRVSREDVLYINKAGQNLFKIIEGSEIPKILKDDVGKAFRSNTTGELEVEINNRVFSLVITPVKEANYANVYGRDISERKKAEQKLKESKEKYRSILENIEEGYFELDLKGNYTFVNEYHSNFYGVPKDEMIGKNYADFVDKKYIKMLFEIFNQVYREEVPSARFEIEDIRYDGEKLIYEGTCNIKLDSNGKKIGFYSLTRDITERKEAEKLIIEELNKLTELDRMRREFISRASHELKTPLTSIYSTTQLLLELYKDQLGENALELVEMIEKGGYRLKGLVEKLLDFSRIESGRFQLNKKMENATEIIRDCISNIAYLANKRNIILNVDLPERFNIELDRVRFEQVVINLLSNAIKNTPPIGDIKINLSKQNEFMVLSVKDSGVGLTRSEKRTIFKKFGKIERYGKGLDIISEGSGLGLFISKEIVENHGGKIFVESKGRNKGANFIVKLPFK